jgi:hypothetical protein
VDHTAKARLISIDREIEPTMYFMNHRFAIVAIFGVLVVIAMPFYFASQLQVGSYAKSPQTVQVTLGAKRMVAGGRATLWYAGGNTKGEYMVSCKKDGLYVHSQPNETITACGMQVTLIQPSDGKGTKGTFRVEWPPKVAQNRTE